ncbi:MAG: 4-(cytidine 5'-diphospho)-2-C-methyl-D-erythritol kinase [Pararhodobacter sp.]
MLAPAKINLTLHVTGQRADGYHLLDSLVVFADFGDRLALEAGADALTLELSGPQAAGVPPGADNLVLRAARLAGARPARLRLDKHLPPASGMGGGSSDAAAALRLLAHEQGLALPDTAALMALGADLPVCMQAPRPCRMRGLGEQIEVLEDVPGLHLLLANPGRPLATPAVFAALGQRRNAPMPEVLPRWADGAELAHWLAGMRNDLEAPARLLMPEVTDVIRVLAAQPGCLLARMTGSGATCFGLFDSAATLAAAKTGLDASGRGWFVMASATAHRRA